MASFLLFSNFGGFLWWLLIRFCNTDLDKEQSENKWARNIFFLCVLTIVIAFIVTNILLGIGNI